MTIAEKKTSNRVRRKLTDTVRAAEQSREALIELNLSTREHNPHITRITEILRELSRLINDLK